jgi:ubiquinone/menaquinone biosynthesis C-methylase UbiE
VNHSDHVNLLKGGIDAQGGTWADFGAGRGAFTLALADLIGPDGSIHAVDRDSRSLRENESAMRARFTATTVHYLTADITRPLDLPPLDGIVLANVLHFQHDQAEVVRLLRGYLKLPGRIIVVEYNSTHTSSAVPHPVTYERWAQLAEDAGFRRTRLLATRPSRWLGEIYSTVSC